jgi:hypothetical protein
MESRKRPIDSEDRGVDEGERAEWAGSEVGVNLPPLADTPEFKKLLELFSNLPEDRREALLSEMEDMMDDETGNDNE